MSFRRNSDKAQAWQAWLHAHQDRALACGIPPVVIESERHWNYFLQHGYFKPLGIMEPVLDVNGMERSQAESLSFFLESDEGARTSDALNRLQFLLKRGRHAEANE